MSSSLLYCRTCWRCRGDPSFPATGLYLCVWRGEEGECVLHCWEGTPGSGRSGHTDQQRWRCLWPSPSGVPWWADRAHHGGELPRTLLGEQLNRSLIKNLELYMDWNHQLATWWFRSASVSMSTVLSNLFTVDSESQECLSCMPIHNLLLLCVPKLEIKGVSECVPPGFSKSDHK